MNSSQDVGNLDRLTRRYKTHSRLLLLNVSKGEFPGVYEEKGTNTQIKTRKEDKVRSHYRGVSQKRYQDVKVRDEQFDPFRSKVS